MRGTLLFTHDRRLRLWLRLVLMFVSYIVSAIVREGVKFGSHAAGLSRPIGISLGAFAEIGAYLAVVVLFRRYVDRRSWAGMAVPPLSRGVVPILVGSVLGAALIVAVAGIELGAGWIELEKMYVSPYMLPGVAISLAAGFNEELLFRGYFLQNLGEELPLAVATFITGITFAVMHLFVSGFNVGFVVSVLIMSTFFVVTRMVTGSLWFAVGFHTAWDWAQTFLVGLGAANHRPNDESLYRVIQHGPEWMVGEAPSIEGGGLFILLFLTLTVATCTYGFLRGRNIAWRARLPI